MSRDSQRAKVYHAETLVHGMFDRAVDFPVIELAGSRVAVPVERRFASLDSVQRYVDSVLALSWVRRRWPRAELPIAVRERRGQREAHYERLGAVIAVPLHHGNRAWALRELVVLHEIAHHLADGDPLAPADGQPSHGPAFTGRLVALVEEIIGAEAGFMLRVAYGDNGVAVE